MASFSNINSEIILFSLVLLAGVIFALRKELALLDVLTLGKEQAINLGVDYDRCIRRLLLGVTLCIAVATRHGGAHLFPWGSSSPKPVPAAAQNLPPYPADPGFCSCLAWWSWWAGS